MHKVERKRMYVKELENYTFIPSTKFIEIFEQKGINPATVRRDLKELETEGMITLTFGGINVNLNNDNLPVIKKNEIKNRDQKFKIVEHAKNLMASGDVVFLAGGTTMEMLAEAISTEVSLLITNSLAVLQRSVLNKNIKDVVLIGGLYRKQSQVFIPRNSEKYFHEFKVHKAFYGASAFDDLGNAFDDFLPEYNVIKLAIANSEKNFLLIDSSKMHSQPGFPIVNAQDITEIITDAGADPQLASKFNNLTIAK